MKGIVFTEFIEMVEETFSLKMADEIIEQCKLPSGGAYTAVGTYDHNELLKLVSQLGHVTKTSVPTLVHAFGKHLFGRFVSAYPEFFVGVDSAFEFMSHVDDYIHVEVRKLYPDAELPRFDTIRLENERLELLYYSNRPFADLAEGLIVGCLEYFGEEATVTREAIQEDGGVRFIIIRNTKVR